MKVEKKASEVVVTLSISLTEMQWAAIQGKLGHLGWQGELCADIDSAVFPPQEAKV